ncbi:hypothetical protein EB796_009783 [Bugula neritina]|uniref:Uncharacterized protein n=1 Tax=Bugula neritina TaxID=10212 RepID=A0A7J7K1N9_BUGNE|nr:hypothetical protein EB796_009783 [Bugula neritina]
MLMKILVITSLYISFTGADPITFVNTWSGNMFQGEVSLTAGKDLTSGWQMKLTFNRPLLQLTVSKTQ